MCRFFGNYPQGADGKKAPIEWLALNEMGNELLIISRYGLDCRQYHHERVNVTWEKCNLRNWLNNDFLKTAFSKEEIERIKVSELKNDDNPKYHTSGGNSTRDRIFCLSIEEAKQYFRNNEKWKCYPTDYARKQGAWVDDCNGCCFWWLRSPGSHYCAARVGVLGAHYEYGAHDDVPDKIGVENEDGTIVNIALNAVRPALWISK